MRKVWRQVDRRCTVNFKIRKGYDVPLAGQPAKEVVDIAASSTVGVCPLSFRGVKQRLKVSEGDRVQRGQELLEDKRNTDLKITAPASGIIKHIRRGHRRFVDLIVIEKEGDDAVDFGSSDPQQLLGIERDTIISRLLASGYLSLIQQRPFSRIADPAVTPKSIFVNAMNTGPFQTDASVVVGDDREGFQAGLLALAKLTDGDIHLCSAPEDAELFKSFAGAVHHSFAGPHPAGNTSVHIGRVDPIGTLDHVWATRAVDLVLIGRLFLDGVLPVSRIISLGGPGIDPSDCGHYRVPVGCSIETLTNGRTTDGELRMIAGDVLSGSTIEANGYLDLQSSSITVVKEEHERRLLGWTMPGLTRLSFSRSFVSSWLPRRKGWDLGTARSGDKRAPIVTGYYDRVMPLNIMVDFLVRAVMAGDMDEAISLGILETDPEDFALCDFICPSKIEFQELIREGLATIEKEGI